MARIVLAGELEEAYELAFQCVDQLGLYLALWKGWTESLRPNRGR